MNNYVTAGVALASLTIGAASGYIFAKKKLDAEYNVKMEEEIARTKDFYKRVFDKKDLEETAFEAGLGEAAEALKSYQTVDTGTLFADQKVFLDDEEVVIEKNIFDNGDALHIDKENRNTSVPYVIDIEEYMDTPDEFEQIQLTYYAGDNVLGDDKDEPINDINNTVGRLNLLQFGASDSDQPHILLVRNEKLKTDFEISYSEGKFAHEVLGFQHSDETFQRTRPRPRREE